jgi:ParB-like chromosome segregation protein Spo0J
VSPALAALVAELVAIEDEQARIDAINDARRALHAVSPMREHPVDLVIWERAERVEANTYNPNTVAPPEMKLLAHSVAANGYTMPIVTHDAGERRIIVDGFHRSRVGKEVEGVRATLHGRLPVTQIRAERADETARIASTVEHNRARGEHRVEAMSELVRTLYQAGWTDARIQDELGMGADEVMRLKQITGLAELFRERDFSEAWEPTE